VLLQIPIGVLLDRFGARVLLSGAMALAAAGTIAFGLAQSLELAYAGRFLIGAGSAVGFIGSMALASQWFPVHRFALLAGLAMLIGMVGGFAGQARWRRSSTSSDGARPWWQAAWRPPG
jgi:MFS family permease